MTNFVLVIAFICNFAHGNIDEQCEDIEVRAKTCELGEAWILGWVPLGSTIVSIRCVPERQASTVQELAG